MTSLEKDALRQEVNVLFNFWAETRLQDFSTDFRDMILQQCRDALDYACFALADRDHAYSYVKRSFVGALREAGVE